MSEKSSALAEAKRFAHQVKSLLVLAESYETMADLEAAENEMRTRVDALRTEERAVTERIARLEIDGQARHDAAIHQAETIVADAERIRAEGAEAVNALKQEAAREIAAERGAAQMQLASILADISAKRAEFEAINNSIVAQNGTLTAIHAQLADVRSRLGG